MDIEKELIEGCIKGDRKSQQRLYDLYAKKMMVVCLRYSKSVLEAEDILQEAFIKIFAKIQSFKGQSRLGYWIKKIVVNTALNSQRSKLYMFPMVDVNDLGDVSQQEEFALADFHFSELLKLIQELPSGCQVIFNLYAIEGYSHKEIAEMLEISQGTSKSQYSRARSILQGVLKNQERTSYERAK